MLPVGFHNAVRNRLAAAFSTTQHWRNTASLTPSAEQATPAHQLRQASTSSTASTTQPGIAWVFLGPPGVGKGTYAKLMAQRFNLAHIATGDLIRDEIKAGTALGRQMQDVVKHGKLLPDDMIFELLREKLAASQQAGQRGYILDGFPRTEAQAQRLMATNRVQLALNLSLRHEVLVAKCLGRRCCRHCGKSYNVADIHLEASGGRPEIILPPLSAPPECEPYLETRPDDTEAVVRHRLQVYNTQASPVEAVFRSRGLLRDFEITLGIPETTPQLTELLRRYLPATPPRQEQRRPVSKLDMSAAAALASLQMGHVIGLGSSRV